MPNTRSSSEPGRTRYRFLAEPGDLLDDFGKVLGHAMILPMMPSLRLFPNHRFERSTTDFAADDKLIRRSPGYHTELATPKFLGLSSTILHFPANSRESRSL